MPQQVIGKAERSIVDLHPQSTRIKFISTDTLRAVARRDRAGTGVDEVVAADAGAMAKRQPSLDLSEATVPQ